MASELRSNMQRGWRAARPPTTSQICSQKKGERYGAAAPTLLTGERFTRANPLAKMLADPPGPVRFGLRDAGSGLLRQQASYGLVTDPYAMPLLDHFPDTTKRHLASKGERRAVQVQERTAGASDERRADAGGTGCSQVRGVMEQARWVARYLPRLSTAPPFGYFGVAFRIASSATSVQNTLWLSNASPL